MVGKKDWKREEIEELGEREWSRDRLGGEERESSCTTSHGGPGSVLPSDGVSLGCSWRSVVWMRR